MKIEKLLESKQQEVVNESDAGTSTAGCVATVAAPLGKTQRRGKGSMLQGIKTSSKFPNSHSVKEGAFDRRDAYQRDYDSSVTGFDKPQRQDDEGESNFDDKMRQQTGMIFYTVNDPDKAQQIGLKQTRTGKWYLRTGNRLAQKVADQAFGPGKIWYPKNESVEEGEEMSTFAALKDWRVWDVRVFNNYYRGKYADYGPRLYSVVASSPEEARQVVIDNADYVLQDLLSRKLQNGKKVLPRGSALPVEEKRVGQADPGTITTMGLKKMLTPDGVQSFKFTNGKIVDGAHMAGGEQVNEKSKSQAQFRTMAAVAHNPEFAKKVGISQKVGKEFHSADRKQDYKDLPKEVDEASFDYTAKDLGNDYAGFPSNHGLKHKFLARIKPEKQQLYKDKMNNMHEFDQLFQLFTVAKQRGDIIDEGVADTVKQKAKQFSKYMTEPDTPQQAVVRDRAKNIDKIRKNKEQGVAEEFNPEYDDEAGSAEGNLHTIARAAQGLIDSIGDNENLPEWAQEKIAKVEGMLVAVWDYLESQEEQGIDPQVDEDWQKTNKQDKTDGMSPKAVKAYRRENPGSKLKTAVTTKPSKLKAGSKDAKRRKSFCARMSGNKGPMKDEKGRPTPKAKALSRWNCESVEQTVQMLESVQRDLSEVKQRLDPKCWKGYKKQGTKMKGDTRVNNCVKVDEAEVSEDKLASDLYKDLQIFKKGADKDIGSKAKDKEISGKAKDKEIIAKVTKKQ